jgi:hypothetical protein
VHGLVGKHGEDRGSDVAPANLLAASHPGRSQEPGGPHPRASRTAAERRPVVEAELGLVATIRTALWRPRASAPIALVEFLVHSLHSFQSPGGARHLSGAFISALSA